MPSTQPTPPIAPFQRVMHEMEQRGIRCLGHADATRAETVVAGICDYLAEQRAAVSLGAPLEASELTAKYDSRADTLAHIQRVSMLIDLCCVNLRLRAKLHDDSKLHEPEKSVFDACVPKLKELAYGSAEYKQALTELRPALEHHYAKNSHHPEHFTNGIAGMSLFDLLEMLMDWKAATERMKDGGDIWKSIDINAIRFGISDQLLSVLVNTAVEMNWAQRTNPV
jgi:hypothetical protein